MTDNEKVTAEKCIEELMNTLRENERTVKKEGLTYIITYANADGDVANAAVCGETNSILSLATCIVENIARKIPYEFREIFAEEVYKAILGKGMF